MEAGNWHDAGPVDELQEDIGLAFRVGELAIAVFREGERIYAVEDFCPHQGSTLSGGLVRDGIITCPLHAWQFRLTDGCNIDSGPGLRTFDVRVDDGRICVAV